MAVAVAGDIGCGDGWRDVRAVLRTVNSNWKFVLSFKENHLEWDKLVGTSQECQRLGNFLFETIPKLANFNLAICYVTA